MITVIIYIIKDKCLVDLDGQHVCLGESPADCFNKILNGRFSTNRSSLDEKLAKCGDDFIKIVPYDGEYSWKAANKSDYVLGHTVEEALAKFKKITTPLSKYWVFIPSINKWASLANGSTDYRVVSDLGSTDFGEIISTIQIENFMSILVAENNGIYYARYWRNLKSQVSGSNLRDAYQKLIAPPEAGDIIHTFSGLSKRVYKVINNKVFDCEGNIMWMAVPTWVERTPDKEGDLFCLKSNPNKLAILMDNGKYALISSNEYVGRSELNRIFRHSL